LSTADEVAALQAELEGMQPRIEEAVREAADTVIQIAEDTVSLIISSLWIFL